MGPMIRIVLADDQALVRGGIRAVLEASGQIEVVAEAANGEAAIEAIIATHPDVAVLDVRMPRLGGIGVLEQLREQQHAVRVILLTTFDDDRAMIAGIRAGACGFLLKDVEVGPLLAAIRRVAAGGDCLAGLPADRLVAALQSNPSSDMMPAEPLTARERHVLGLMSAGLGNQEIADALQVAVGTVKNHVSVILAKLQAGDRTKAVLRALRDGLL
jgi:DNA-binding NarL/FixJ family response regulator